MNMTVVIISKRSVELVALCGLLLLTTVSCGRQQEGALATPETQSTQDLELPAQAEALADDRRQLNDQQVSSIVKDFGGHLKTVLDDELNELVSETVTKRSVKNDLELQQLKAVGKAAGEDIKTRIELSADANGSLPQMGLGAMASSFVATAGNRLSATSSYIGSKIRSLSDIVKVKIPPKLRHFFKWPTFLHFKIRFHKNYKSVREELYRQMIFLRSHIVVGMQSLRFLIGRSKYIMGQNQYSDWTEKEYLDKEGNHNPELSPDDLDSSALRSVDDKTHAHLEELAKSGKNIFGKPVAMAEKKRRKKRDALDSDDQSELNRPGKRQRREKRHVDVDESAEDELNYDEDELNYSEDDSDDEDEDEDEDYGIILLGNELDQDDNGQTLETFKMIDSLAAQIDMGGIEKIEQNLDAALNKPGQTEEEFRLIDLRDTNCIINPENQNGCGYCYSIVMNSAISYYNCMEHGLKRPVRYHPKFVSDCGRYLQPVMKPPYIDGCNGGRLSKAFYFAKEVGVMRFSYYDIARISARKAKSDECVYPPPEDLSKHGWPALIDDVPVFKRSKYTNLRYEEVSLHLKTVGPVFVNLRTWLKFKDYKSGIVDEVRENDLNVLHSMLIVGQDKDAKGEEYWIIQNSHGVGWGERGYLRVYKKTLRIFAATFGSLVPERSSD